MTLANDSTFGQSIPRPEFPRPDFTRDTWQSLNGAWAFEFDDENRFEDEPNFLERTFSQHITVPYCYQSALSGIEDTGRHPVVWYRRSFHCDMTGGHILLKFGAVDYHARVWINGVFVGEHKGGHTDFSFDITTLVRKTDNHIVVKAADYDETDKPRGKQSWTGECFGCWYTATTGIWQSVWLEQAGDAYVKRVKLTPDVDRLRAVCEVFLSTYEKTRIRATLHFSLDEKPQAPMIYEATVENGYHTLEFSFRDYDIRIYSLLWMPHAPNLIDVTVETLDSPVNDKVGTYFGMRKLEIIENRIFLNNHNLYQRLVLDQGYWPESLLTPPSDEAIIKDIELIKQMGFNGVRKHQKMEDPRFYYWADKMGLLVWGELPSAFAFNDNAIANTAQELTEFIARDYNHPSIIQWVTINESWGTGRILTDAQQQDYARMLFYMVKAYDQTRLVSINDGWEQPGTGDICALHDYGLFAKNVDKYNDINHILQGNVLSRRPYAVGSHYEGQPILMTEFGGIAFDNGEEGWGYFDKVQDEDAFFERLEPVVAMLVNNGAFCGFCYTQLTDVMQEVNGLLNAQREPKVDMERLHKVFGQRPHTT